MSFLYIFQVKSSSFDQELTVILVYVFEFFHEKNNDDHVLLINPTPQYHNKYEDKSYIVLLVIFITLYFYNNLFICFLKNHKITIVIQKSI